jgi:hypothetical protein
MRRKKRNRQTKSREREQSDVDYTEQQTDYCSTYHLIDKGNGVNVSSYLSSLDCSLLSY